MLPRRRGRATGHLGLEHACVRFSNADVWSSVRRILYKDKLQPFASWSAAEIFSSLWVSPRSHE